ncbi:MAG: recombinase family protein [Candidatus Aminicenantes bacterium]|nr:MAG: recombinase family protein [Candidatus Aminicenantes bacterium]
MGEFKSHWEIDPEKAKYVKKCFELYASGKFSISKLTELMVKTGFTVEPKRVKIKGQLIKRKERPVGESDIYNILINPIYFRKFYYKNPDTGERELYVLRDTYPVIIKDWKLFEKVQKILKENNSRANGSRQNKFKFSKLIICGFCDLTLTGEEMSRTYKDKESNPLAKEAIYYHCSNGKLAVDRDWYRKKFGTDYSGVYMAKKGKEKGKIVYSCPQKWWKEKELEEWILSELESVNYGEELYEQFRSILEKDYEKRAGEIEKQIKVAKAKQTTNKGLMVNLVRSIAGERNEEIKETMRQEYEKIREEQNVIEEEIRMMEVALNSDTDKIVNILHFCTNLKDQYLKLDEEGRKNLLSAVFSKIIARKRDWRLNRGKGKRVKVEILEFEWNQPWKLLKRINLQELIAQVEAMNIDLTELDTEEESYHEIEDFEGLTKKSKMKASLIP